MRIKTLMVTVSLALFSLALPQAAHAQEDGEPRAVIFDANNYPILKFSNRRAKDHCGLFVGYTLMDNQEEAFVVRVSHMHWAGFGFPSWPESGWLYITPSRLIFNVEVGDKSHSFDIPRTALKDKPVTRLDSFNRYPRLEFNLREKLPASNSRTQKFAFFVFGDKKCAELSYGVGPGEYFRFLVRAVKDFNGTMAEFKQVVASLKQSGKIEQSPPGLARP